MVQFTASFRCWFLLGVLAVAQAGEAQAPLPFPDMAPTIGGVLAQHYYDAARIRPRLMVERALRGLEQSEVGIDTVWADGRIVLNLRGQRHLVEAPEPADLPAAMRLIEAVRLQVERSFDAPAGRLRELAYAKINGALSTLDPHTVLWPPETAREWAEDNIQGQFYGIGAFLNQDEGLISIQRVMPGLPAERAGVEDGDVILAIDGEKTAGLTLEQAVRRIKGPKGTTVILALERRGLTEPVDLPIVRDLVKVITMRSHRDGDVGYVRMDEFNANTAHDLFVSLRKLERTAPIKALVLDLRFNGGGLLDQAKLIGGFFLGRGQEVVRTTSIDGSQEDIYRTNARRFVTVPMLVLTSPHTASAGEIVAGALQLNERAVIAGESTFGKGSVQNIRELRDGSRLKLTIQEYLLPGAASIQDVGVTPDLKLVRHGMRQDGGVSVRDRSPHRERDNEFALGSRRSYDRQPLMELGWVDPWLDREARRGSTISAREFRPDRQGQLALDLLKSATGSDGWEAGAATALAKDGLRPFLLERLGPAVAARTEIEASALAEALARLPQPVRWGAGGTPPPGSLTVTWTGPASVTAGETVALSIQVENRGQAEVGRLFAVAKADPRSPFWEEEFIVGVVPAAGSARGLLHLQVPPRLPTGEERFTIELRQAGASAEPLASCEVALAIEGRPRPHLGLAWRVIESNGDGRLSLDERAELQVEVFNEGDGTLEAGAVWVDKDNNPFVSLGAGRQKIEQALPPGGSTTITIPISVRKELTRRDGPVPFAGDRVTFNIFAVEVLPDEFDARNRADVRATIEIPIDQPLLARRLVQPAIAFGGAQADGPRTRLRFSIADRGDGDRHPLDLVALFQDEDKVDLQSAGALDGPAGGPWTYSPRVTLRPGLNNLQLVVRDAEGLLARRLVRLWGPAAAPVAGAAPLP